MQSFQELISEAATADIDGWGFEWLEGRATEERPPWAYARLLGERLGTADSALDIDTGGGEVVNEAPRLPQTMYVTESWQPNLQRARELLGRRGVTVIDTSGLDQLPVRPGSIELVSSRHPVRPRWSWAYEALREGGRYLGQHVGPESARELSEFFLGPLPPGDGRDPSHEAAEAERAGLTVVDLQTARLRMEFFDVGAVVWILRKCVWWVPDFSVERYLGRLRDLDAFIRSNGSFVAHSTRHLIEAHR